MIKFDSESINARALSKLQQDPSWNPVASNSVISAILRSNSEVNAETARYAEYLFKESKWDTAQNTSSILAMAGMLGYQPKRKISSIGNIYVSTDDKILGVGSTITLDDFKKIIKGDTSVGSNWSVPLKNISIDSDTRVQCTSNGLSFIPLPTAFEKGTKVTPLTMIQGVKNYTYISIGDIRSLATVSRLDPYLYIPVYIQDAEDASNVTSRAYFSCKVIYSTRSKVNGSTQLGSNLYYREYRIVDNLQLSSGTDYDVEIYNDLYNRSLFYLKFNNDPLRGRVLDITNNSSIEGIEIEFIKSEGANGNIRDLFRTFTIRGMAGSPGTTLYGINVDPIIGGKDEESVADIKKNAPAFYINNYTVGTKEAYETTIANLQLPINTGDGRYSLLTPKKVNVYGAKREDKDGNLLPITCVTFTSESLADIVERGDEDTYELIDKSLTYYLSKLKSPQDTIKFVPPNYVSFAVGVRCKLNSSYKDDKSKLEDDIRDLIDSEYGQSSDKIDFDRNVYASQLTHLIMGKYPNVVESVDVEMEAIHKINWSTAERILPTDGAPQSDSQEYTIRVNYNWNNVFIGHKGSKGFKDYTVSGSKYAMRVDIMYRRPKTLEALYPAEDYHVSIFVHEGRAGSTDATRAFYTKTSTSGVWDALENEDVAAGLTKYTSIFNPVTGKSKISELGNVQQVRLKETVYDDDTFSTEISGDTASESLTSSSVDLGALDDFIFYYSGNPSTEIDSETFGSGWLEFSFDSIYRVLSYFSIYDPGLKSKMLECPLSVLKCGTASELSNSFSVFTKILKDYVDIYVSMRPNDTDLIVNSASSNGNTILYIDSQDTDGTTSSLFNAKKKSRMISVSCNNENSSTSNN